MEKEYKVEDLIEYMNYTKDEVDDSFKKKLETILKTAKSNIEGLTGTKLDFVENSLARELLENYCRYSLNNAIEYFEDNFQKAILRLIMLEGVKANGKEA